MCYDTLKAMGGNSGSKFNAQKNPPAITEDQKYEELILTFERLDRFPPHPKMERLKRLVLEHLLKNVAGDNRGSAGLNPDTRVMVLVTYSDCIEEIVDYLNVESSIIKATKFVGQATDKGGGEGFSRREQIEVMSSDLPFRKLLMGFKVITRFKAGEFNLLVSTSIGEEGLDIGQIDLIVCYDTQTVSIPTVRGDIAGWHSVR